MAAFIPDDAYRHPADFDLLQNGPVHHQPTAAAQRGVVEELVALGYARVDLHATTWSAPGDLHDAVIAALGFPAFYGRNLDALQDCLSDVAEGRYGWDAATATGLAVSIEGFAPYVAAQPEQASSLLEIAARCSGYAMLFGHRVLWLLEGESAR